MLPAVFGDVFQLLDRDNNGQSEYSINTTNDMRGVFTTSIVVLL